ncbi:MAG: selenocysteine-specific translation elongation factor [Candidatus Aminicenantes bacterium]|nr:selenocysteine-specific translation elongation factor [Candidatus Aminicenantes bacterium]
MDKDHVIVGTAGHIDHGKSSLVKALTGIDPDTLPEEKERGMTIELGFVFLDLPDYERQVVFIDVPGHEKFVKTMVAGASNVDAVLFIVAADEGISVQTREHFDILRLLRVEEGIIALTKSDLADPRLLEERTTEVKAFVRGTFLENAPVIPVSAVTGAGLEDIKAALRAAGRRVARREDSGYFRMPIDRVFTIHGFGTVIAGTVLSGEVRVGDKVEILPDRLEARVRGIQVHKAKRDLSGLGHRTALNLHDVEKTELRRGQCVARPGFIVPTSRLDARLHLLAQAPHELKTRDRVRLHVGTDEVIARVVLLEREKLLPGESMLAQFVLESPTTALFKDRFIIRTFSPLNTIGGGEVFDTAPPRHKRFDPAALDGIRKFEGSLEDAVERTLAKSAPRPLTASLMSLALGKSRALVQAAAEKLAAAGTAVKLPSADEPVFLPASVVALLKAKALAKAKDYFAANPQRAFMPPADLQAHLPREAGEAVFRRVLEDTVGSGDLVRVEGGLSLPGHEARFADRDAETAARVEAVFRRAGFEPPLEEDACRDLRLPLNQFRKIMGALVERGRLVRLDPKVTLHRDAFEKAKAAVLEYLRLRKSITISETKDVLKVSRKYACAVLEYLDKRQVTRRAGDVHVMK